MYLVPFADGISRQSPVSAISKARLLLRQQEVEIHVMCTHFNLIAKSNPAKQILLDEGVSGPKF